MPVIASVEALQILDSRANPTMDIEVDLLDGDRARHIAKHAVNRQLDAR